MVPKGKAVDTRRQQTIGEPWRQTGTVGCVLRVGDDQIQTEFIPESGYRTLHGRDARRANYIAEKEDPHEAATAVAGRTWI
jgi:hypothetical protein